jgi:hypothetical protein
VLATVVDTSALGKVILASLAGGIGVTIMVSLALLGAVRFADLRRQGRSVEAGGFAALAALGSAAFVAAVVVGIIVMTSK